MKNKELERKRAKKAVELLESQYPDAKCSLESKNAFELLIATRLSAQCTDVRVNIVTSKLFKRFPTAESLADADLGEVEKLIKTCGLYKTKAKDLVGIGKMLIENFGGIVPDSIEDLIKLPGVGRKTANLICGDVFKKPAIVADTHFIRICNRLGFVSSTDPFKVEIQMKELISPKKSNNFCHRIVMLGRQFCTARVAHCDNCCLSTICEKNIKKPL